MLRLYLEAPFAVCRTFTAGWYRPTALFITHSAAYGLLVNVAGIDSRLVESDPEHGGDVPASRMRPEHELPSCRLAVGLPADAEPPSIQSLFQQLHNYPVGADIGVPPERAKGGKNNITPVRREVLVKLRAVLAVDEIVGGDLESRIVRGIRGELNQGRYGLPFVGDNNFLVDRLQFLPDEERHVRWYRHVAAGGEDGPYPGVTRLTTYVDRADTSRTRSALFAPTVEATLEPPDDAWVTIGTR
jgi:CRISPR-associated protein Cas5t